ncbi:MAG: hypothetical protein M1556_01280 [Candidatus Thermoplasmatota archaeon]|jgi:hypothetical protein|nr:hypothetical protein [Candidatus Thermoplasmatota archaeon]
MEFRTVFKNGSKYVVPINGKRRKITKKDRKEWHRNAEIGERRWENISPRQRRNRRNKENFDSWGFKGKSPRTRDTK